MALPHAAILERWNSGSTPSPKRPPTPSAATSSARRSDCATSSRRSSSPTRSGLDVFGVGEHHRPDFAVSAPAVVLAAAAERTTRIRLTSAVTVLSSDDPIRVFQHFATLDLLSGGRAEIMAGRGSFIESFPLFGYDLNDYDRLFEEKLDALLRLGRAALTRAHPRSACIRVRCRTRCRSGSRWAARRGR